MKRITYILSAIVVIILSITVFFLMSKLYANTLDYVIKWEEAVVSSTGQSVAASCAEPTNLNVRNISSNSAVIEWDDAVGSNWEYVVQDFGSPIPTGVGAIATAVKSNAVTTTMAGVSLSAASFYEFYVRTKCGATYSQWEGPFIFRTHCNAVTNWPFVESFDTTSPSKDCWTILDRNKDGRIPTPWPAVNIWAYDSNDTYKGNGAAVFNADEYVHDDWLITPELTMNGGLYELVYYYKTDYFGQVDYEVLLSNTSSDWSSFTHTLQPKKTVGENGYTKVIVNIQGYTGPVYVAWHVVSSGYTKLFVDEVSITPRSCYAPEEAMHLVDLQKTSATIQWDDSHNQQWEYYVTAQGAGVPNGSGSIVTKNSATVTAVNGGANLVADTAYDFYVRASCGTGKTSRWVGPFMFKTVCNDQAVPFVETFNSTSTTSSCWTILDALTNPIKHVSGGKWEPSNWVTKEGNGAMYYSSFGKNNDWLMSAPVTLDATKIYRITYYYRNDMFDKSNFEVMLSDQGPVVSKFTKKLVEKKDFSSGKWLEEKLIVTGVGGSVSIGFHMIGNNGNSLYVDSFSIEEVSCAEPLFLGVKDEKRDKATIYWTDDINSSWEYVVQVPNAGMPKGSGTTTTQKEVTVSQLSGGVNLNSNTSYEYYVRSVCKNSGFSDWQGPFVFRTACDVLSLPFQEGFNTNSTTKYCWEIIDGNKDGLNRTNMWYFSDFTKSEGTHGMAYEDYGADADDWLISPAFNLQANKKYRLKYKYAVSDEDILKVYVSNKGKKVGDFTTLLEDKHIVHPNEWQSNRLIISNLAGPVYLGWKVEGADSKNVGLDDIVLEEVKNCPEPIRGRATQITYNQATISWTDQFGATQWNYVVQAKGSTPPTGGGVNTNAKSITVTQDVQGNALQPNTEYEVYVRTICSSGVYSDWSEPMAFKTICGIYKAPFFEGFNSNSKTRDCWTKESVTDISSGWYPTGQLTYEGDGAMAISLWPFGSTEEDWLITPALDLENGQYLLKYRYKTNDVDDNSFAVKLSKTDTQVNSFGQTLVPLKVYKNPNYVEEVVVFNATQGINYIGWQVLSDKSMQVYLDHVSLTKVTNCIEPIHVTMGTITPTSIGLSWTQTGPVQSWEVKLVDYMGNENSPALATVTVTGNPSTVINGLTAGKGYKAFVRAKCMNNQFSDWGTALIVSTAITNDDCSGALTIPVNAGKTCDQVLVASMFGATDSTTPFPDCYDNDYNKDMWFEFTALSQTHVFTISDLVGTEPNTSIDDLGISLYEQNCGSITSTAKDCYQMTEQDNFAVLRDLIVGHKYLIRIGLPRIDRSPNMVFKLCLTTYPYISTDDGKYTPEQLVKNVLIESTCDLISNVSSLTGIDFGEENGIGYFERGKSNFAFDSGIILATNGVKYASGPSGLGEDYDSDNWLGDSDLEDLLNERGDYAGNFNASVLEFDFVPIANDMSFDFIFASNEYGPSYQCGYSDIFAFLLTDLTTNERKNIAVVPHTDIPISVTTIHDAKYQGMQDCGDANKEYFDKYYGEIGLPKLDNAINYAGRTVPMQAHAKVVPGRKYHIKLAIADYSDTGVNSAVFLKAGSFKIGEVDLGADLTVSEGTALCSGTTKFLDSGMDNSNPEVTFKWLKDGQPYPLGDNKAKIEVGESGNYEIEVNFKNINCPAKGKVKVEMFPELALELNKPADIAVCRNSTKDLVVDLSTAVEKIAKNGSLDQYELTYYEKENQESKIESPNGFVYQTIGKEQLIYLEVKSKKTGCMWHTTFKLVPTQGATPTQPKDVVACGSYELPKLEDNQTYYSEAGGKGKKYKGGDVLGPGNYELYIFEDNGLGCYEEVSFKVAITVPITVGNFEDVVMTCSYYVIPNTGNKQINFYRVVQGSLVPVLPGTVIYESGTELVVVAETEDKVCREEARFVVSYEECPIPKGFSPNGDGINDTFDLSEHGVSSLKIYNRQGAEVYSFSGHYTNQWDGKTKGGKDLPAGTYYYVVQSFDKTRTGWVQLNR